MVAIVSVYESGLIRALDDDGVPWSRKVANEVKTQAVMWCPGRSGALAASHRVEQNRAHGRFTRGFSVSAGNGLPDNRALWVHNGTGLYGPRGTPIVPLYTEQRKFLHMPPGMGFPWTKTTVLASPRKRQKGIRGPYIRIPDPADPYGHAESSTGQRGTPWLRDAGLHVAYLRGAI